MEKKWLLVLSIFSVLTFIFSAISCTLIFYSEKTHTKINGDSVVASNNIYKSTSIVYNGSNTINLSGLNPGDIRVYTFEINNNNSNTIKYDIKWEDVNSNWDDTNEGFTEKHPEELIYSLSCTDGKRIDNKQMPSANSEIILENSELKTNATNTCTLSIGFVKKDLDQSYNLNKSFGGTYKVIVKE